MALKGNKGEWSEIYTLLKLLGEGKLYIGDENQNKIKTLFYPILQILRTQQRKQYDYKIEGKNIIIFSDNKLLLKESCGTFKRCSMQLLPEIKNGKGTFEIAVVEPFLKKINCNTIKADSTTKADIRIVIHDMQTQTTPLLGFSIKSHLGGDSTLVNAGKTTNFCYSVDMMNLSERQIAQINGINTKSKIKDRIETIINIGGHFRFESVCNQTFNNNLQLIDTAMPQILAEMLYEKQIGKSSSIKELCALLEKRNPLKFDLKGNPNFYRYKIKHFLLETALGLMPSKVWDGKYNANGGYIIVKEDGDIICYHIYNKNMFEDYLFFNTKLETASSTRHKFGILENINGKLFFKLNLQIRFV